ncbi:hypothetical protein N7478_011019 [Penicillium angulare]|uniref:uncharacterized protein n=1 Tax=Penicillium angulare TaxID=116970 RepID=UPI00253FEFBB|nr:uncharacterized protein N7478_011019 [Penicillium angulare]KAJ5263414.1 hypothetical protein N7478_011019 [Penicillium angulare]
MEAMEAQRARDQGRALEAKEHTLQKSLDSNERKTESIENVLFTADDGIVANEERESQDSKGKSRADDNSSLPAAWDEYDREDVNLDSLDLGMAHQVDRDFTLTRELGSRNPRWNNKKAAPLTDPNERPKGWTTDEPDLDPRALQERYPDVSKDVRVRLNDLESIANDIENLKDEVLVLDSANLDGTRGWLPIGLKESNFVSRDA